MIASYENVVLNSAQVGPNEVSLLLLGSMASQRPIHHRTPKIKTASISGAACL